MPTATPGISANPGSPATLSKKERKQLRKQMMERKEKLLAKHGRGDTARAATKSKLPADPPKPTPGKLPSWTPPTQPTPHRALVETPTPQPSDFRGRGRRSLRPRVRDTVYAPATANVAPQPAEILPGVVDLDAAGPGPLTRAAAWIERVGRRAIVLWKQRPWRDTPEADGEARRSEAYRSLSLMIKPLRTLGIVAIAGAIVLGRESRGMGASDTGSLVVLGMGLGLAVVLLALAEIAGALRTIARRL